MTHELGHAFVNGTSSDYSDWTSDLNRADPNRHKDDNDRWFGFKGPWDDWQFGWSNTSSEIFADMYIGWVYDNTFDFDDPEHLGITRRNYMNLHMLELLLKYTEDIP